MSQKDTRITILGDGGWGTALSLILAERGHRIRLWGAFPDYVEQVRRKRENVKFLAGFKIPESVQLTSQLHEACAASDWIVLAAPTQHLRSVLKKIKKEHVSRKNFVNVAKGIEIDSLKIPTQIVRDEMGAVRQCVISGPTLAREVALRLPTAASVASEDEGLVRLARETFSTETFTLFESHDVIGVEVGGAVKNVIAIAAGIVEGLGLGANTRAVLFARGTAEMARLGEAMGARRETFMGLSGLGDLATTCLSPQSRNRSLGEQIGKGRDLKKILKESEMVVEGVSTAKAAVRLAKKHKVVMPITEAVDAVLFHGKNPRKAVAEMLSRGPRRETD